MLKFFGIFCLVLISREVLSVVDGTAETSSTGATTATVEEKKEGGIVRTWTSRLSSSLSTVEPAIESTLNQLPEQFRPQFITLMKTLLQNAIPGGGIIAPLLEAAAKKYTTPEQLSEAEKNMPKPKSRDTTDIILYRLIAEDIQDEHHLKQFMDLGSDSAAVKQVVGSFMVSLKKMVDVFVKNYQEKMRDTSELIVKGLETKHA